MTDGKVNTQVNSLVPAEKKNIGRTFTLFSRHFFVVRNASSSEYATQLVTNSIVTTGPAIFVARNKVITKGVTGFATSRALRGRPVLKKWKS